MVCCPANVLFNFLFASLLTEFDQDEYRATGGGSSKLQLFQILLRSSFRIVECVSYSSSHSLESVA